MKFHYKQEGFIVLAPVYKNGSKTLTILDIDVY